MSLIEHFLFPSELGLGSFYINIANPVFQFSHASGDCLSLHLVEVGQYEWVANKYNYLEAVGELEGFLPTGMICLFSHECCLARVVTTAEAETHYVKLLQNFLDIAKTFSS